MEAENDGRMGETMTDEERKKLVADLREFTGLDNEPWLVRVGRDAADEIERLAKQVCELDRQVDHYHGKWGKRENDLREALADIRALEIRLAEQKKFNELLAEELRQARRAAQSDAEPVAWQYRIKQGGWGGWREAAPTKDEALACINAQIKLGLIEEYELRPLYTAPPRPDASAGMIEVAEWHEAEAIRITALMNASGGDVSTALFGMRDAHQTSAKYLRARAADSNAK